MVMDGVEYDMVGLGGGDGWVGIGCVGSWVFLG